MKRKLIYLNIITKRFSSLIQTLGILSGIVILILTYWSTIISQQNLQLSISQYNRNQLPIREFVMDDSLKTATMKPFTEGVKIQWANAIYPETLMDSTIWEIDPPKFELNLWLFSELMVEQFEEIVEWKDGYFQIGSRNTYPVGIEINYVQYGQSRIVKGIFAIEFQVYRSEKNNTKVVLKGIHFDRYLNSDEILLTQLNNLISDLNRK